MNRVDVNNRDTAFIRKWKVDGNCWYGFEVDTRLFQLVVRRPRTHKCVLIQSFIFMKIMFVSKHD